MSTTARWIIGIMCSLMALMILSLPFMPNSTVNIGPVLAVVGYLMIVMAGCIRWRGQKLAGRFVAAWSGDQRADSSHTAPRNDGVSCCSVDVLLDWRRRLRAGFPITAHTGKLFAND